jgi:hypothetical protein
MLSKRIAGILKQYPNPEVAFFATEVLTGNATSVVPSERLLSTKTVEGHPVELPDSVEPA